MKNKKIFLFITKKKKLVSCPNKGWLIFLLEYPQGVVPLYFQPIMKKAIVPPIKGKLIHL